jgi:hypothetical protein
VRYAEATERRFLVLPGAARATSIESHRTRGQPGAAARIRAGRSRPHERVVALIAGAVGAPIIQLCWPGRLVSRQSERSGAEGDDGELRAMSVTAEPAAGYGSGDKGKQKTHPSLTRRGGRTCFIVAPWNAFVRLGR